MTTEMTPAMRRSILIATLRDKTLWPKHFEWNYHLRCSCAMGLAERLWKEIKPFFWWGTPCPELGLSDEQVNHVFGGRYEAATGQASVTPEMVADRLEEMHRSLA